ncbi:MAG TPA: tRNA (adenosine(37)-N6)-threonylcarbamoyltransferase complex ATPase subunit type 1 TsaE, partial [Gammaproteobacteria bacterium]|nr:tRNA (adenosine(37)-N6)-threonylcarbamoyltransferase complex ATPase subunit type 1 TsaE [Gammaproteobacteria bacterium]
FTRGFLRGLGYTGHVKSPTYTIVEAYELPNLMVFHFDFYRLQDPEELEYLGIKDYFSKESICLIEWPDLGGDMVPAPDLRCYFTIEQDTRHLTIHAESDLGKKILGRL